MVLLILEQVHNFPRKEGGRGLISAADRVDMEQLSLNQYIHQS